MMGMHPPAIVMFVVCVAICWYLAWRDIQLSTILMLVLEAASVAVICVLAFIAIGHHGVAIDTDQLTIKGSSLSTLGLGVVVAIFSLVGFEAATAFGDEAKNPLTTIPRSVWVSLIVTGAFFVFISYVEIVGLAASNPTLDKLTTPLSTLATMLHVDVLQIPIDAGAMVSFFSLAASCMNSGARVMYQMGKQGFFHGATASSHAKNETPHIAVSLMAVIELAIPIALTIPFGLAVSDAFNDAGTFGAFGFLGAYFFVSVAAPMYLKKIGELKATDTLMSGLAVAFLLVPAVGSVYPVPAPPVNLFPFIFLAYFAIGLVIFVARRKSTRLAETPLVLHEPARVLEEAVVA
jgi:amino acid transporter